MSNEIQFEAPVLTGETLYAVIARVADGYRWNTATPAFEARNTANWTDYDIALDIQVKDTTSGSDVVRWVADVRLCEVGFPAA